MAGRRVAVTGIGAVTPVGIGVDAFWRGLNAPQPATAQRRVDDFDPEVYFDNPKETRRADRFTQFAIARPPKRWPRRRLLRRPARIGVWVGHGVGGSSPRSQIIVGHDKG